MMSEEMWESLNQLLWLAHQELQEREDLIAQLKHDIEVMGVENSRIRNREGKVRRWIIEKAEQYMSEGYGS